MIINIIEWKQNAPFISTSQIILLKGYNLKPQKSQREEEEEEEGDREPSHLMFLMSD